MKRYLLFSFFCFINFFICGLGLQILIRTNGCTYLKDYTEGFDSIFSKYKFSANSINISTELKVSKTSNIDNVLKPNHHHLLQQKTDQNIQLCKRLPDIIFMGKSKENNIGIRKMDILLTRKTEVLTLYVIEHKIDRIIGMFGVQFNYRA